MITYILEKQTETENSNYKIILLKFNKIKYNKQNPQKISQPKKNQYPNKFNTQEQKRISPQTSQQPIKNLKDKTPDCKKGVGEN